MKSIGIYYLARLLAALVSIPWHEAGHALASWLLGDPTAKNHGRLSLNPLRHFDLLGTLFMVVAGVGWAKPVPADPRRFKNPKRGMALTALAGPVSNLALAYLSMVAWKLVYYWECWTLESTQTGFALLFFRCMVLMNVSLAVFNLLPVPPLDGSRVALAVLPRETYFHIMRYERVILVILLAMAWFGVFDTPLSRLNDWVWDLLDGATFRIDLLALKRYWAAVGTEV